MKKKLFHKAQRISAMGLREAIRINQKLQLIDLRMPEDYAKWHIPGAVCADINEELKAGRFDVLESLMIDRNKPVVFVCEEGILADSAAEYLSDRGFQAFSLEQGMLGWSMLWDTAIIEQPSFRIIQLRRIGKGCISYMIISQGEAMVIDPSLYGEVYIQLAEYYGARITCIFETHLHADHLMRGRYLAHQLGVRYYLPRNIPVFYEYFSYDEKLNHRLGAGNLTAIHTPGHTPESFSLVWNNEYVFTGDMVFHDGVGRPDLRVRNHEELIHAAELLVDSLYKLIMDFPHARYMGGHFRELSSNERGVIWFGKQDLLLRYPEPEQWRKFLLPLLVENLPSPPPHFEEIIRFNKEGNLPISPEDLRLESGKNRCATH